MSEQRLCAAGVVVSDAPCHVCGRTAKEPCGRPGMDPRDRRIAELEAENAELKKAIKFEQTLREEYHNEETARLRDALKSITANYRGRYF